MGLELDDQRGPVVDPPVRSGRAGLALWAALASGLVGSLPGLMLNTALPEVAEGLGTTTVLVGWGVTAPMLASAVAMPVWGKIGDLHGHRRVLVVGIAVAGVGALATALAWDVWSFIALRVVTQVAGFAIQPAAMAMISAEVSTERQASAFGAWALVTAMGPAIGLVLGGVVVEATSWPALFVMQAGLAVVALLFVLAVPSSARGRPDVRFDLPGAMTLGLATFGVMLAFNQGIARGWTSGAVVTGITLALLGAAGFWWSERGRDHPLIPASLLASRPFTTAVSGELLMQVAIVGAVVITPVFFQAAKGYSVTSAAFALLVVPGCYGIAAPLGGRLTAARGGRTSATVGAVVMAVGCTLAAVGGGRSSAVAVLAGLGVVGLGNGLCQPGYTLAVARAGGQGDVGIATATERMLGQIGAAVGSAILLAVAPTGRPADFAAAMLIGLGMVVAALLVAVLLVGPDPAGPPEGAGPVV